MIIALASPGIAATLDDGLDKIKRLLAEAAAQGAQIVCFLEAYLPAFADRTLPYCLSTTCQAFSLITGPNQDTGSAPQKGSTNDAVCIPNISPAERRRRLVAGVIPFAIALVILATLLATGVDRWWRLPLLLFFWAAAAGFFQWRDKT